MADAVMNSDVLQSSSSDEESAASVKSLAVSAASPCSSPGPSLSDCTPWTHVPAASTLHSEDKDETWVDIGNLESPASMNTPSMDHNDSVPETSAERWTEFFNAERVHDFVCFAASEDHEGDCAQGD